MLFSNNDKEINELEEMKRKHDLKMQKIKLEGKLLIEEGKVKNEIKHNQLKSKKEQLSIIEDIRMLKLDIRKNKGIINSGNFLLFWATIATLASTILTISGLWDFFSDNNLKLISFIAAITLTQFSVYILARQDTNIKKDFKQHGAKIIILKNLLLLISVYGNYTFFLSGRDVKIIEAIVTIALCIAIDLISIYCISIAQDFKTLNKNVSKDSLYKGIIGKLIYNLTFSFIDSIEKKYSKNIEQKNKNKEPQTIVQEKEKEKIKKENPQKMEVLKIIQPSTFVQDRFSKHENVEKVRDIIIKFKDKDISPSVAKIVDKTGLTRNKVVEAKKVLERNGIIKTVGTTTFVLKEVEENV